MAKCIDEESLVIEILSRLPAKSILRFRSVCKAWNELILHDPLLVNLQLNRSIERNDVHIALVFNTTPVTTYSLDPENPSSNVNDYPTPCNSFTKNIGYCDGLVCTKLNHETISVWNASTRNHITFPFHGSSKSSCGFFYDPNSRKYKLLSITSIKGSHSSQVMLHSIGDEDGDGKGKLMDDIPYQMVSKRAGVVANGAVHWLAFSCLPGRKRVILAFNPACQKFEEIPVPFDKEDALDKADLAQLCGSLSIVFINISTATFQVWLMEDYGIKDSWAARFLAPTKNITPLDGCIKILPLCITRKGELILQINYKNLFICNPKKRSLERVRIEYPKTSQHLPGIFWAIPFVDSLVDVRKSHGGGQTFLKNKPESRLQRLIRTSSPEELEYLREVHQRYREIAKNTPRSPRMLDKLLKESNMDVAAASEKLVHQEVTLAIRQLAHHYKEPPLLLEISGYSNAGNLVIKCWKPCNKEHGI